jgi:cytochrome c biogenesis protein CcdA/thiol-disulfide isomerase/thioredoxin
MHDSLLYGIAFLAGVITAVSPCAYPVLPIVFAGGASGGRRRPYAIVAGLAVTFFASLLFLTWLLDQLHIRQDRLRDLSIALLLVVAATLIVPRFGQALERPFARLSRRPAGDLGGGFVLGASLGIVFVPCAGPTVTAIAAGTASVTGVKRVVLALIFVLGVAVVLLLIALGARRGSERLGAFRAHVGQLRLALGIVIAGAALAIYYNVDQKLQTRIGNYTASLQSLIGEKNCDTRKQLGQRCVSSSSSGSNASSSLKNFGPAPNFTGISNWINSKPLTTADLRGKVVLVDFWTYSCINCLRTLPHLKAWDAAYRKAGLEIVGVHTPEFAFEHVVSNVRKATKDLGVRYPVAIDNGYRTWNAYQNAAWPTEYLIDRHGDIREIKEGEGDYDGTEEKIRTLLGETAMGQLTSVADTTPRHFVMTPESYLGWQRLQRYAGSRIVPDRVQRYRFPSTLPQDALAYAGRWRVEGQRIVAVGEARLRLHFYAQSVHLVLGGSGRLQVLVDGKPVRTVRVRGLSRLYTLLRYPTESDGLLELRFTPGISAYAFTFG